MFSITTTPFISGNCHKCTYGEAALKDECARIRATPKGSRTHTHYGRAVAIGELIPEGHVSRAEATRELIDAGVTAGLDRSKAEDEVNKGIEEGMSAPWLDLSGFSGDRKISFLL